MEPNAPKRQTAIQRRQFIKRLAMAGFAAAATGSTGFLFRDQKGPGGRISGAGIHLPDFRKSDAPAGLAVARGLDREQNLIAAMDALGGMAQYIKKGDRVLLKVNAAFASPPLLGATTHPNTLRACIHLCQQAGASDVVVTDNPINDPASCFELTGLAAVARETGARVYVPRERDFAPITLPKGRLIRNWPFLRGPFRNINRLIGLAPVKDHHRSGASMTLKNWYGLLGGARNVFHQEIHTIISELGQLIHPSLVILDGTQTMMTNGPTGGSLADLKDTGTLIAGTDSVAVDAMGAELLDKTAADLPHLKMAQQAGVGRVDYTHYAPRMVTP